ncbi:CDP-alcohol phosphatidyltransferase family protein [Paracoccus sp. (in: a-proteobacteria)]|uniref:CDP-alcohol phosphatidyltransferase family protein n=1 Tax=Paracoccus sp. TaxID=267 RepID=UPI00396CC947
MQMLQPDPATDAAPRPLPQGLTAAVLTGLAVHLVTAMPLLGQGRGAVASGLAFAAATAVVVHAIARHYPYERIGAANAVTLIRLALTTALVAPLLGEAVSGWLIAGVALFALVLDGVDGFLARRSGLASEVGGRFDMEVDAAMALVLACHAWVASPVGAEVLVLGIMRYLFIGLGLICPWVMAPLPVSMRRKTICVLQLAALILLQLPQMPADLAITVARVAAIALLWSFGRDLLWLRKHR